MGRTGDLSHQADIARAKGELVASLPPDGLAVLNAGVPLVARGAMTSEALTEWVRAGVVAVCPQPGLIEAASKDDLAVLRSRCRTIGESLGQGN